MWLFVLACNNADYGPGAVDADGDGFLGSEDCNDANDTIFPGAEEVCNLADDDCDGLIDDRPSDAVVYYADVDNDGFGDASRLFEGCEPAEGASTDSTDCDDTDGAIHPAATEVCDGLDNDCNGIVDTDATELTTWYADSDGDGYGDPSSSVQSCDQPVDYVLDATDCDDGDFDVSPETLWYGDADGDGAAGDTLVEQICVRPAGYAPAPTDCDDFDETRLPGAIELCDGVDNDCDGILPSDEGDDDADGYSICQGDCADSDASRSPGAIEQCNGVDDACSGSLPADEADGDGDGQSICEGDCADSDSAIYVGAPETWYDGVDSDCSGGSDHDQDGDGEDRQASGGEDRNDLDGSCSLGCYDGTTRPRSATSCATLLADLPSTTSGVYWLDLDDDGNPSDGRLGYCDMNTDSGGWTLFFAYAHAAGANDALVNGTLPISPTTGYSHVDLNTLGMSAGDVSELRFYCDTQGHSRIIHFKTSDPQIIAGAVTASQSWGVADWTSGWTPLSGHSANIPGGVTNVFTGTGGLWDFPFWIWGAHHWGVRGTGHRWECDDFAGNSGTQTLHQVWLR